jgi:hypothetical protein
MMHKTVSAILGVLSVCAGIVAFIGYAYPALQDLLAPPPGVVIYGRSSLPERFFAVLVIWGLTMAAFYMGFRFLRFLILPRKP